MKLELKIKGYRSDDAHSEVSSSVLSIPIEKNALHRERQKNGPPRPDKISCKVDYGVIRKEWRDMQERGERMNKSALARKLKVSVALVRGVLNSTEPYRSRELRQKRGFKKTGLILGSD